MATDDEKVEIVRRFLGGESVRAISRAVGVPRMSVYRVIRDYEELAEVDDAEFDDVVGSAASFDIGDADPEVVERCRADGVDLSHPDVVELLADLTADPGDALALWRLSVAPKTAEWLSERTPCGVLKTEQASINDVLAAGFRYRNFQWWDRDGQPTGTNDWRELRLPS